MTDSVVCPVDTCSFDGSISAVADHIEECADKTHTWRTLGYEDADAFCRESHLEEGRRLEDSGREARDLGRFDVAIDELEGALYHFRRAESYIDDTSSVEERCRRVVETIDEVEVAERVQAIDDLVDRAENAIDTGDESQLQEDPCSARREYEEALDALEEALTVATELAPDRVQEIERRLSRVRIRQQSLELSEPHREVREMVGAARDHADAGDRAFQESEYEVALEEYEAASDRYESLADVYEDFSFDDPSPEPTMCDVCRHRFDEELDTWCIDLGVSLQVCPACARFGPDGNLPSPREVATEHRSVVENVENIRDGNVGLDWTSDAPTQSPEVEDDGLSSDSRDTRQMLVQLVGLYQQLGELPTADDVDEGTDFGYLEYRDEFGSLSDALEEAGFEGRG